MRRDARIPGLALGLGLLLASPAQSQDKAIVEIAGKHYDLKSSTSREKAQDLLDFMELVHATYLALLQPENEKAVEGKRFALILFQDEREYLAAGAPRGSGAFYNGKALVGYYDEALMKPFFAHEGMHQFTDITSKNMSDFPMWFTEGIADCIGNSEVRNQKLYMCVKSGLIARMRLPLIQQAIRANKAYPLATLLSLDRRKFMQNAGPAYAQSWSFCHFLITYPKMEDRSQQIPNGRFRKHLAGYYELMRRGDTTHDRAWALAFKGIPLAELEEAWKKYVLKMDAGRYLGVACAEISASDADQHDLGKDYSAIRVDQVMPKGAAERGGMKPGDLLVRFQGRRFPRGSALSSLRIWMQDIPYGRNVKAVVLRNGQEVEVTLTWDEP